MSTYRIAVMSEGKIVASNPVPTKLSEFAELLHTLKDLHGDLEISMEQPRHKGAWLYVDPPLFVGGVPGVASSTVIPTAIRSLPVGSIPLGALPNGSVCSLPVGSLGAAQLGAAQIGAAQTLATFSPDAAVDKN